jgi:hypothetical protein
VLNLKKNISDGTNNRSTVNGIYNIPTTNNLPRSHRTMSYETPQQSHSLHKTENRLTRISLAIVWMFLFCHVWKLIPTMYEAIQPSLENVSYIYHYIYKALEELVDIMERTHN